MLDTIDTAQLYHDIGTAAAVLRQVPECLRLPSVVARWMAFSLAPQGLLLFGAVVTRPIQQPLIRFSTGLGMWKRVNRHAILRRGM